MSADLLFGLMIVFLILGSVFLVLSCFLFFRFNVPEIMRDLHIFKKGNRFSDFFRNLKEIPSDSSVQSRKEKSDTESFPETGTVGETTVISDLENEDTTLIGEEYCSDTDYLENPDSSETADTVLIADEGMEEEFVVESVEEIIHRS